MSGSVTVQPFDFQSDFAAPKQAEPGRVELSAAEFASYLSQARAEGLIEGQSAAASEDAARMDAAAQKFTAALRDLLKLAEHLDATSGADGTPDAVRALIKSAAQRLIDGQGDLFAAESVA